MIEPKSRRSKRRLEKSCEIAIVGTGLSSLSCALSLLSAGFCKLSLYERDSSFSDRRDGYGLTLTYNPKGPLASLGLLEDLARQDCPSRSHYEFDPDGNVRGYFGNAFLSDNRGTGQRGNLRIPRQVLRKIMMKALQDRSSCIPDSNVRILWGKEVTHHSTTMMMVENKEEGKSTNQPRVTIYFEDGTRAYAGLLIGADGINSPVMASLLEPLKNPKYTDTAKQTSTCYLKVMIILGITNEDFFHSLLDERGFYTLDGTHRLFTMPFAGNHVSDLVNQKRRRRIMWQLSYLLPDLSEAHRLSRAGPKKLLEEVKRRIGKWHEPIGQMLDSTPLESVWGTPLQDRDPQSVVDAIQKTLHPSDNNQQYKLLRTVLVGDSIHPMSPFKGQGANQALSDGPLLVSWLQRANLDAAIRGFQREMVQRSKVKVYASRVAAEKFHNPSSNDDQPIFTGIDDTEKVNQILNVLKQRKIGAHMGSKLDFAIKNVISEYGLLLKNKVSNAGHIHDDELHLVALDLSARGDLPALRQFSIHYPGLISKASVKETGETCLHLAVKYDHYWTCKWLLQEVDTRSLSLLAKQDNQGRSALHVAVLHNNLEENNNGLHDVTSKLAKDDRDTELMILLAAMSTGQSKTHEACWGADMFGKTPLDYAVEKWAKNHKTLYEKILSFSQMQS